MNGTFLRICGAIIAFAFLAACDMQKQAEVRADYEACMKAMAEGDGETAAGLLAQEELDRYGELLEFARRGSREDLRSLGPSEQFLVIAVRHWYRAAELEGMDGRAFVVDATKRGYFESATWDDLGSIEVRTITARGELLDDSRRPTGHKIDFYLEDGRWKVSEQAARPYYDHLLIEVAQDMDMSAEEMMMWWLEEETGRPVRPDIWDRPTN